MDFIVPIPVDFDSFNTFSMHVTITLVYCWVCLMQLAASQIRLMKVIWGEMETTSILLRYVLDEEAEWVVLRANKNSALGPDSIKDKFYQHLWHLVQTDARAAIKNFLRSYPIVKIINKTCIVLILKKQAITQIE